MENFNYEQFSDEIILNFFMKINDNNDKELAEECQKILNNCLISRVTITSYLNNITFFIGNAHIYENNINETKKMLNNEDYKFNLNV